MGLRYLVLLLVSVHCLQIWGRSLASNSSTLLNHVLEAEIDATKQQLALYQQKAALLSNAIKRIQSQHTMHNASIAHNAESTTTQRRSRSRESPQLFSDWFEPQGTFRMTNGGANSTLLLTQLISFRPNTSPVGRRQHMTSRRKTNTDDEPPLQFLLVLDPISTAMRLLHPTTFELMWQHALDLHPSSGNGAFQVADMFFVSDRSSYLAILLTSGDLTLFKLRLWHNRRIVAGDPRRLKPLKDLEENRLQCSVGQNSINALDASQPPWLQPSNYSLTSPAPGKYLHVDVERVFGAKLNQDWQYDRGKVAVVPLYYRVFVVASDSSGEHLSFFHADNGSFIKDIHTQVSSRDGTVVHLEPIHSSRGLVALATQSRVFFVDASVPHLVPVVCEAPGRNTFTSLAADPLRPTIVYAGTSTGRSLVYKLHNLGAWRRRADPSESHGPVTCTLAGQLMPRRPPFPAFEHELPAIVQTLPGFLVLGAGHRLVLYQLSGSSEEVQPTYLLERSLVDSITLGPDGINAQHPRILGVSATNDLVVHSTGFAVLVADTTNGSHRLDLYESRIPPPGTNVDIGWIRVPAMMICALAAMFWQQKGRLAYSAGGRSAFSEAELAGLLSGRGGRLPSMGSMNRGGLNANRRANDWY